MVLKTIIIIIIIIRCLSGESLITIVSLSHNFVVVSHTKHLSKIRLRVEGLPQRVLSQSGIETE